MENLLPGESSGSKSWAEIVKEKGRCHEGYELKFISPEVQENETIVRIELEEVEEGIHKWKHAVIGFILGSHPPYHVMKKFVENKWKHLGQVEVIMLKSGVFIFNFATMDAKEQVLENSPWPFMSKMLFIKPWSPEVDLTKEELKAVPIWIRLPNLKLHYYSANLLSKMASAIGVPLFTDKQTADQSRLSFARICVEVQADRQLPNYISYISEGGVKAQQEVQYEWLPPKCSHCKVFGHADYNCHMRPKSKMVWRVKEKEKDEDQHKIGEPNQDEVQLDQPLGEILQQGNNEVPQSANEELEGPGMTQEVHEKLDDSYVDKVESPNKFQVLSIELHGLDEACLINETVNNAEADLQGDANILIASNIEENLLKDARKGKSSRVKMTSKKGGGGSGKGKGVISSK